MFRSAMTFLAALVATTAANGHFIFVVPTADGSKAQVVLSEDLSVDEDIDASKFAATTLSVRGTDGKDQPLTIAKAAHHLDATIPGKGDRVVFGTTNYGVLQKGDAKPFQLKYHPKAILGTVTAATAKVGGELPVEIVPVIESGKIRFQVLAKGKPVGATDVTVLLPSDKKEKVQTDKDGFTRWFEGSGRFGAWTRFAEATARDVAGKKFEEIHHYATLVVDTSPAK